MSAKTTSIIERLGNLENTLANEHAETVSDAADIIISFVACVRYADTRAVSRAAYPHACVEERKLRDLIDAALKLVGAMP